MGHYRIVVALEVVGVSADQPNNPLPVLVLFQANATCAIVTIKRCHMFSVGGRPTPPRRDLGRAFLCLAATLMFLFSYCIGLTLYLIKLINESMMQRI